MESVAAYENYAVGIYGVTPLNIFPDYKILPKIRKNIIWQKHLRRKNLLSILHRFVMEKFKVHKLQLSFLSLFSQFCFLDGIRWMMTTILTWPNWKLYCELYAVSFSCRVLLFIQNCFELLHNQKSLSDMTMFTGKKIWNWI